VQGQLGVRKRQGHQTQDRMRIQMRSIRYEGQEDRRREAIGDMDMICFWVAYMTPCISLPPRSLSEPVLKVLLNAIEATWY
jgi:hypothetical protein